MNSNPDIHGCQKQEYILCILEKQVYVHEEVIYSMLTSAF